MPTTEVERSVALPAPPEDVWDAIVDPDLLGEWFGGTVEVDLEPGGELRVSDDAGTDGRRAVVETVDAPTRLTFTWVDDGPPSTVEITLVPNDDGCEVRVTERLLEVAPAPASVPAPFPVGFQGPARPAEARALARV
jgi:uncharacterized protein YndB with AHSA1/START domain